jgi:hypothetical protein
LARARPARRGEVTGPEELIRQGTTATLLQCELGNYLNLAASPLDVSTGTQVSDATVHWSDDCCQKARPTTKLPPRPWPNARWMNSALHSAHCSESPARP